MPPSDTDASIGVKIAAVVVLLGGLLYCLFGAGLAEWSREDAFQVDLANFALFAGFIVVAGAIERFLEPLSAAVPFAKPDKTLIMASLALIIGIIVSSIFGLYFLEAVGVKIGTTTGTGETAEIVLTGDGDHLVRGLDIFITALIITGGAKPLHDLIKGIEKAKESAAAAVPPSGP